MDLEQLPGGVVVCETFDEGIIDKAYQPFQNQILQVIMHEEGHLEKKLLVSTLASYFCHPSRSESFEAVKEIFKSRELQFSTFTITEKGYNLKDSKGAFLPIVLDDISKGPSEPKHTISIVTSLLLERFQNGAYPIAMVSTDNFSHNGKKFQESVLAVANGWKEKGFLTEDFIQYLSDESRVSFPWSMIDRITPNPARTVADDLEKTGLEHMQVIHTAKGTNVAGFANTEVVHYLVIEDSFPNGRPPLELAGVILTDRETVNRADAMKVTTCLNPLHTSLAIFGCLLNFSKISDEMQDQDLVALIRKIGYKEGLPVVDDPGIISPKEFIDQVITKRLPNPYIPDTPQRIAADTSQKVAIRFGETIQKYMKLNAADELLFIPLTLAAWLRYLLGVDDKGIPFIPSSDPLLEELQAQLFPVTIGYSGDIHKMIEPILSNENIFGINLYTASLGERIEKYFAELIRENGAVRSVLEQYLKKEEAF